MWAKLLVLGMVASCYSPHISPGAPCSTEASCPEPQSCALVAGNYVCVEGRPEDAGPGDAPHDTSMQVDTSTLVDTSMLVDTPMVDGPTPKWTLIQTSGSSSPTRTIAATGAGHLIVVAVETSSASQVTSVTDNAGNIYVAAPNARSINTSDNLGLELWYAPSSLPGATAVTASASTLHATVVWEVGGIRTTAPLDTATKLDDRPASTTPVGASITTSFAGEFVVSAAIVANMVIGIHAGNAFTNDHLTYANGWAHLTDPAAPAGTYQAQWDQPMTGGSCASSAAFVVGP